MHNVNKSVKFRISAKMAVCVCALAAVILFAVGGTLAYIFTLTGRIDNKFPASVVTTDVVETLDGNAKKNVSVKNTGDTTAYIRAKVIFQWEDEQGNVFGAEPEAGTDYTITWTSFEASDDSQWILAADGFYYYTSPVEAGYQTDNLIEQIQTSATKQIGNTTYYLSVDILCSGIQASPDSVVKDHWSSGVSAVNNTILTIKKEDAA